MISNAELIAAMELGVIYGIVSIGIFITFRVLDFPDLTCDGSFTCGAALSIMAIKAGFSPAVALFFSLFGGGLAGITTGIIHIYCKVSNLLSGILVAFMLYSINLKIMENVPNISLMQEMTLFDEISPVLGLLLISSLVFGICYYIFSTDFGLGLRALGQNKKLCISYGVRTSSFVVIGLGFSNAIIALGGGLLSQYQGLVDISQGTGTIITALAAIIIGEKVLPARDVRLLLLSTIVGSIIYRLIIAASLHSDVLGINTADLNLITGLIIIAIMNWPKLLIFNVRKIC